MGPHVLGQGWGEEARGSKGIGKEDGESTVKEEYRRKEGRVAGKVVEMAKEWKEKERRVEGENYNGEEKEEKGQDTLLFMFFSSSAFLCLFCKHRQGHHQNIETMK